MGAMEGSLGCCLFSDGGSELFVVLLGCWYGLTLQPSLGVHSTCLRLLQRKTLPFFSSVLMFLELHGVSTCSGVWYCRIQFEKVFGLNLIISFEYLIMLPSLMLPSFPIMLPSFPIWFLSVWCIRLKLILYEIIPSFWHWKTFCS